MNLPPPPPDVRHDNGRAAASALGTPSDFRGGMRRPSSPATSPPAQPDAAQSPGPASAASSRKQATETIAQRAGALSDEIAFPEFVAGLVHGTFDAIVDSAIRQMESYASLVSAVAKPLEDFTRDNVSENQAKDWLVQQYPKDLYLSLEGTPSVLPRPSDDKDNSDEPRSPQWLASFGVEGQELTPELIQGTLIPEAQKRLGRSRQQMLATMVLLGLNRVVVRDGSISARLRFRADAADHAKVDYAVSDDPSGDTNWGARGQSGVPGGVDQSLNRGGNCAVGRESQGRTVRRSEDQLCQRDVAIRKICRRSQANAAGEALAATDPGGRFSAGTSRPGSAHDCSKCSAGAAGNN